MHELNTPYSQKIIIPSQQRPQQSLAEPMALPLAVLFSVVRNVPGQPT